VYSVDRERQRIEDECSEAVRRMFGPAETSTPDQPICTPAEPVAGPSSTAGVTQVNADIAMTDCTQQKDDLKRGDLGIAHFQCMAARATGIHVEAMSIAMDPTFGKNIKLDLDQVGSLNPPGDQEVLATFHGARAKRGMDTVNQSVSMSIDPNSLTCIPVCFNPSSPPRSPFYRKRIVIYSQCSLTTFLQTSLLYIHAEREIVCVPKIMYIHRYQ